MSPSTARQGTRETKEEKEREKERRCTCEQEEERKKEGERERPSRALGMFSQMRGDTVKTLPAQNFIDDEIRNRCDLLPRYVPSIIYK